MLDIFLLAAQCAPDISPQTLVAITKVESNHNPYAIGIVDGYLVRQPKNKQEALATAQMLHQGGWNFSMGIGQVNLHNLPKYSLTFEQAFEPCENLRVASKIFNECYQRALSQFPTQRDALLASYSCYYSGNFTRGFKGEGAKNISYVDKIVTAESGISSERIDNAQAIPVISTKSGARQNDKTGTQKSSDEKIEDKSARVSDYKSNKSTKRINELRGN